jgi:tetratricopeptide (TPR) repeat protein
MKPKELLFAHRYVEAAEAYRNHLLQHPDQNYYPGLGQALLSLKQYSEALSAFRKANEMENRRLKGSHPCLNHSATALWLNGEREEGLLEWHHAVTSVLEGTVTYADAAGGATQGLLLWYASITIKNESERNYAMKYLDAIAQKKVRAICWPHPIALMVLGEKSFADVLETAVGCSKVSECIKVASGDLLKRRRFCQTLFYAACQDRQNANDEECVKKMGICLQLENPILECEWYLARGEAEVLREL